LSLIRILAEFIKTFHSCRESISIFLFERNWNFWKFFKNNLFLKSQRIKLAETFSAKKIRNGMLYAPL
jgi:hypothetical protein